MWFCEQHNTVNKWLQKPEFDCSWENLLKRYKTGYDHCKDGNGLH
jgi:Mitochondrial sulfhydryl oxidase involved in the biogenesis of cytosolic Fe/S proteins